MHQRSGKGAVRETRQCVHKEKMAVRGGQYYGTARQPGEKNTAMLIVSREIRCTQAKAICIPSNVPVSVECPRKRCKSVLADFCSLFVAPEVIFHTWHRADSARPLEEIFRGFLNCPDKLPNPGYIQCGVPRFLCPTPSSGFTRNRPGAVF